MSEIWTGKSILIIGAARQGLALARFFAGRGAVVTLNDQRQPEALQAAMQSLQGLPVQWVLGEHPLELLEQCDLVCVSGGVPLDLPILVEAQRRGIALTNDSQIFMDAVRAPVIGITGSAGKTTTTTLVGRMVQSAVAAGQPAVAAGQSAAYLAPRAWIGGNIGLPLVEYLDEIQPDDRVVIELSSFQLELMTRSPQVAAVLNITPNHLDRHGTLEAYTAAKARILTFQTAHDVAVLNREDPGSWGLRSLVRGQLVTFGLHRPAPGIAGTFTEDDQLHFVNEAGQATAIMACDVVRLRGEHNLLNVLAACALAIAAGLPLEAMRAGVRNFAGVAHRLEWVRRWRGADWYNDSIATAPERTIAAIQAFDEPLVLLLGGRDKNLPWEKLAELVHQRVDHLIVFGEASDLILRAIGPLRPGARLQSIQPQAGLQAAVQAAADVVEAGGRWKNACDGRCIVLLSPGGTSFDAFKDFEERGERYQEWVKALP